MSQEISCAVARRPKSLLPHDAKDVEKASDFATKKKSEMENLSGSVEKMGFLKIFWDSKVPEKDKTFYYFISLSFSNREHILKEIKKYQLFYKTLKDAVRDVKTSVENSDDSTNHYKIINDVMKKLSEMADLAIGGEGDTASKAMHKLHKSFIAEHEKLEDMIKIVERVALKDDLKKATVGWQESTYTINALRTEMNSGREEHAQMREKFEEQNVLLSKNQKDLQEATANIKQSAETIYTLKMEMDSAKKENAQMCEELKKVKEQNTLLLEKQNDLLEAAANIEQSIGTGSTFKKDLESAKKNHVRMCEELNEVKKQNKLHLEKQNDLLEKISGMEQQQALLLQKIQELIINGQRVPPDTDD